MIYISDTTAITNLAAINQLHLLRELFHEINIPQQEVYKELTRHGDHIPGAKEVKSYAWIKTHQVTNKALVNSLLNTIDAGEAEAIALALELHAQLLIIDEFAGRQVANDLGVKIIGILGILLLAKKRNLITAIKPHLMSLRSDAGFRLSQQIIDPILREAGELE